MHISLVWPDRAKTLHPMLLQYGYISEPLGSNASADSLLARVDLYTWATGMPSPVLDVQVPFPALGKTAITLYIAAVGRTGSTVCG